MPAMARLFVWRTAAVLALSACVPSRSSYLKPSAPGGYHVNSTCAGMVGPKDRLILADSTGVMVGIETFRLEEISQNLRSQDERDDAQRRRVDRRSVSEPARSGTGLSIILHVPNGRSLRFASRSFVITDRHTLAIHEREPERVFADSGALMDATLVGLVGSRHSPIVGTRMDIGETLTGAPDVRYRWTRRNLIQQWFGTRVSRPYYLVIELDNVQCRDCQLRLPSMTVDSMTVEFPEIRLQWVGEWSFSSLNC